ncbi:RNA polymerase sigma factor [Dyadobacter crusticola]|uniref:RNA polymerase sigma factor n=1 Tax=Dyadobacter crusticola TaxID=292407 RepID=UPI0004E10997|nr:sigma-70 family RNA polymerase sigma factor [Dyadobacter crusticola]
MKKHDLTFSETELVALLKAGDNPAFKLLHDRYAPALSEIIHKIIRDEHQVEDIVQDTLLKIWIHIGSYQKEKGTLFTWMLNIARNTAIDRLRTNLKFKNHVGWETVGEADIISLIIANPRLSASELNGYVERLSVKQKQVIELIYFQDFSHEYAAAQLGIALGTVKSRVRSALMEIREMLSEMPDH